MPPRIEYKQGDPVGTKGCLYICEKEPIINKSGKKERVAVFSCSKCKQHFVSLLKLVRLDKRQFCDECSVKKKEYNIGDLLGPNKNFIYLGEAGFNSSNKRKVKVKNINTGEIFDTVLTGIINGHTKYGPQECYKFSIKNAAISKTKYKVNNIIENPSGELFLYKEEYKEKDTRRGLFLNLQTGVYFYSSVYNVAYGLCTGTKKSIGEEKIEQSLNDLGISYMREKTFPDLRSPKGACLRYDFWIPKLKTIIEYDGQQHYVPVEIWGGIEHLQYLQQCDKIKDDYAREKGYKIIRVNYKDKNNINKNFIAELVIQRKE